MGIRLSALVVNLFGAPCAGKSTAAAYIFSQLKMKGINCELATESNQSDYIATRQVLD